jgi:hypothetical protein
MVGKFKSATGGASPSGKTCGVIPGCWAEMIIPENWILQSPDGRCGILEAKIPDDKNRIPVLGYFL